MDGRRKTRRRRRTLRGSRMGLKAIISDTDDDGDESSIQVSADLPLFGASSEPFWRPLGLLLGLSWAILEPPRGLGRPSEGKMRDTKNTHKCI